MDENNKKKLFKLKKFHEFDFSDWVCLIKMLQKLAKTSIISPNKWRSKWDSIDGKMYSKRAIYTCV